MNRLWYRLLVGLFLALLLPGVMAYAKKQKPGVFVYRDIPEDEIVGLTKLGRENITKAVMRYGMNVPPETPEELAKPILPKAILREVIEHGRLTEMMYTCRMDWQNEYLDFKDHQALDYEWTDKQMAFIDFLHGVSRGHYRKGFESSGGCTPGMQEYLRKVRHF